MVKIIAHRGDSAHAPENTLYSFKKAIEAGADAIETDVRKTKDGVLVLMHDPSLKRLSDDPRAQKQISEMTYAELLDIDISSKHFPELPVQHIAALSELLELISKSDIELNLELKPNNLTDDGLEYSVLKAVAEHGIENRVFYSSFDHTMLANIIATLPSARIAPLYKNTLYRVWDYAAALSAFAIHPELNSTLTRGELGPVREAGIEVNVWTVNEKAKAEAVIKAGATGIITNYPAEIKEYVSKL